MLRPTKGNMYDFITHTWNPIKGRCLHDCSYCYMKAMYKRFNKEPVPIHLDEKEMKTNLGSGNYIFVGSSCDMWGDDVSGCDIRQVLVKCGEADGNHYLFQSKNPGRFIPHYCLLPKENTILCTTLESDFRYKVMGNAPHPLERARRLRDLSRNGYRTMVTVEPIIDFTLDDFVPMILGCNPFQVNIGADTGNNHLPEPTKEKVLELISELEKFTKVVQKKNLGRLLT